MVVATTERLILRNYLAQDLIPFIEMNACPKVMSFFPKPLRVRESAQRFHELHKQIADTRLGFYAVESKESGQFMGFTGLNQPAFEADFTPCVEIGWRLRKEFWGQGFAAEAATAVLDYGWRQLKLDEIVAIAPETNLPSISVMKKIGMTLVKPFRHPSLDDCPRLVNCLLYSVTRHESLVPHLD